MESIQYLNRLCPLCDSQDISILAKYSKEPWQMTRCTHCHFVFLKNAPTYDSSIEHFDWSNTSTQERVKRRTNRKIYYFFSERLKHIKRAIRKNQRKEHLIIQKINKTGNFLDIGCGDGNTLRELPCQFIPYGIEISPSFAQKANTFCVGKGGWVTNADSLSGLDSFGENFFNIVLMRSYLEHEINPLEVLKKVSIVLKPDGIAIIKVPNFNSISRQIRGLSWPGFRFPDHVNYFTPDTLSTMIEKSGLRIAKFNAFDHFPTSDNMWLLASKA